MKNNLISAIFIIFVLGLLGSSLVFASQQEVTTPSVSQTPIAETRIAVSPTPTQPPAQIQRPIIHRNNEEEDD